MKSPLLATPLLLSELRCPSDIFLHLFLLFDPTPPNKHIHKPLLKKKRTKQHSEQKQNKKKQPTPPCTAFYTQANSTEIPYRSRTTPSSSSYCLAPSAKFPPLETTITSHSSSKFAATKTNAACCHCAFANIIKYKSRGRHPRNKRA